MLNIIYSSLAVANSVIIMPNPIITDIDTLFTPKVIIPAFLIATLFTVIVHFINKRL